MLLESAAFQAIGRFRSTPGTSGISSPSVRDCFKGSMKILVVDDEPVSRNIASTLLRNSGYTVLEAADGEMAWQTICAEDIRLVLSDWIMPNVSGLELCSRIRAAGFERYIYVVLCTWKCEKGDYIRRHECGR